MLGGLERPPACRKVTTLVRHMSNPGDFEFDVPAQQTAGQAAPGWYFAEGDPPGTERYWNGTAWEGTYRAAGGFQPAPVVVQEGFPGWVKVVAWIVTIMKVLPLIALAVLLAAWNSIADEIRDEADFELRDFTNAVLFIGLAVLIVGIVLLLGQLIAVMKEQPGRSAIWSGILTLLDLVVAVPSIVSGGVADSSLVVVVLVLQGGIFGFAVKTWNDRRNAPA